MASGRHLFDIEGFDVFEEYQGGAFVFTPAGSPLIVQGPSVFPSPVSPPLNGNGSWFCSRIDVGRYLVTLLHAAGLLKTIKATLIGHPNLEVVIGPVVVNASGQPTIEIDIFDPSTGELTAPFAGGCTWTCRTAQAVSQSNPV